MNDIEKGWLAGMFDGEGCVALSPQGKGDTVAVQVSVSSTNEEARDTISQMLSELAVQHSIYAQKRKSETAHRQAYHIRVRGLESCLKIAEFIEPMAIIKRHHWRVVREFCAGRLSSGKRSPYSAQSKALIQQSRDLNRRGPAQTL